MATGLCDNLLMAAFLSATCPVLVAPAMDEDMWLHPSTKDNLKIIRQNGCRIMNVGYGDLASGLTGEGRMAEPEEIQEALYEFFRKKDQLKGKKVIITAGPTYEAIDPVRFIGNHSSGKMGYALANEFADRGAEVTLISGPVSIDSTLKGVELVKVTSAEEMIQACLSVPEYNIAVMAAAVADYTPSIVSETKIKKEEGELTITLKKTRDILAEFGKNKKDGQVLVGFALETNNETENALKKLKGKNADIIVLNSLNDKGAGFGHDSNKVKLFFNNGKERDIELKSKTLVSIDIVDSIIELL